MGNCVEVLSRRGEEEERAAATMTTTEEKGEKKGRMRIKVVLTKEELQWLMEQIKENGGKGLEELLEEIEKGRKGGRKKVVNCTVEEEDDDENNDGSWRPSLESIMECPEVPDQMQR